MSGIVSSINVKTITGDGELNLTDATLNMTATESIRATPRASITLPLHTTRKGSRIPYTEILAVGDPITIDASTWDGTTAQDECALDGVIDDISQSEVWNGTSYQPATTISCSSYASILEADTVAWWLYAGTIEGAIGPVMSKLLPDQLNTAPYKVAFNYLSRVALYYANYSWRNTHLEDVISLQCGGLEALAEFQSSLQHAEGPHLGIVRGLTDEPFHELFVTTRSPNDTPTTLGLSKLAKNPRGARDASTTITFRAAPFPHVTPDGRGVLSEWQGLPLTKLEGNLERVNAFNGGYSRASERNFFMAFPGFQALTEEALFASGAAVANKASVARFGYLPMKIKTRLIYNAQGVNTKTVEDFIQQLTYRLAGQWANGHIWHSGQANVMFAPHIHAGTRVRASSPWHGGTPYEWYVSSRSLNWNPEALGSTTLSLERGMPVTMYEDPNTFSQGLETAKLDLKG
jgi:hypothetical protein